MLQSMIAVLARRIAHILAWPPPSPALRRYPHLITCPRLPPSRRCRSSQEMATPAPLSATASRSAASAATTMARPPATPPPSCPRPSRRPLRHIPAPARSTPASPVRPRPAAAAAAERRFGAGAPTAGGSPAPPPPWQWRGVERGVGPWHWSVGRSTRAPWSAGPTAAAAGAAVMAGAAGSRCAGAGARRRGCRGSGPRSRSGQSQPGEARPAARPRARGQGWSRGAIRRCGVWRGGVALRACACRILGGRGRAIDTVRAVHTPRFLFACRAVPSPMNVGCCRCRCGYTPVVNTHTYALHLEIQDDESVSPTPAIVPGEYGQGKSEAIGVGAARFLASFPHVPPSSKSRAPSLAPRTPTPSLT
jgi:hypothetical protein